MDAINSGLEMLFHPIDTLHWGINLRDKFLICIKEIRFTKNQQTFSRIPI